MYIRRIWIWPENSARSCSVYSKWLEAAQKLPKNHFATNYMMLTQNFVSTAILNARNDTGFHCVTEMKQLGSCKNLTEPMEKQL